VLFGVIEQSGAGWLVGDQQPHLLGVIGHELQPDQAAAAAAEHVRRLGSDRGEQPMRVVGEGLDRRVLRLTVERTAGQTPRVVGHHGVAVGEQVPDRREAAGVRRAARYAEQDRAGAADLVAQGRVWGTLRVSVGV